MGKYDGVNSSPCPVIYIPTVLQKSHLRSHSMVMEKDQSDSIPDENSQ